MPISWGVDKKLFSDRIKYGCILTFQINGGFSYENH